MCPHGLAVINLKSKSHESEMQRNLRSNTLVWTRVTLTECALLNLTGTVPACGRRERFAHGPRLAH